MAQPQIKVTGLKELRKELKALEGDDAWKPAMKSANMDAANVVVREGKSLAGRGAVTLSGTHATMGSAAIATIRALGGATRATVAGGRASVPWFGGWNFGSHGRYRQFPRVKEPDYSLYTAIDNKRDEVIGVFVESIDKLTGERFR